MKKVIIAIIVILAAVMATLVDQVEYISADLVEIHVSEDYGTAYELYRNNNTVYVIAHGGKGAIRGIDGHSHKVSEYIPDFVASKGLPTSDMHVLTCKMNAEVFDYGDVKPVYDKCDISGAVPVPGGFAAFNTNLSRISAHISYYTQKAAHAVGIDSHFAVHLRF